ncbi:MAG: DUF2971 domain-containing protein [Nevskia sp.]|nr:DUF2971 domain-containing protein [Nevskia sp.]
MEGAYRYENGLLAPYQVDAIYSEKNRWHLLSLTKAPDNLLMWSHYASGHSGMVVGVEVTDTEAEIEPVTYVTDLSIKQHTEDIAQLILRRKYDLWSYEEEVRAFKRNEGGKNATTFIKVKVKEVIFGTKTDVSIKILVTAIAKKFCPGVVVRTMKRDDLRTGRGDAIDA